MDQLPKSDPFSQKNTIITGPGLYRTRNGRKVTIHEIKFPPGHIEGETTCFPAKGSIWKRASEMGTNPPFGIWHLCGRCRILEEHSLDIIARIG